MYTKNESVSEGTPIPKSIFIYKYLHLGGKLDYVLIILYKSI